MSLAEGSLRQSDSPHLCDELKAILKASENLPKIFDFIQESENNDIKCIFTDYTQIQKSFFPLPELNASRQIIGKLLNENENLALECLYNINQITALKSKINATNNEIANLSHEITKLQSELSFDKIYQCHKEDKQEAARELKQLEEDLLSKSIDFDEYFNKFKAIKLEQAAGDILAQIYKNRYNNSKN